ncbi:hypothetical protein GCM10011450_08560 [Advenella faeciporci]|uniref:DUF86 domain-containing protein n=1 Tax=Advenella faeciporci TaxID=797535 RepID=A0A918MX02_9BURK|nr:hypothetical protein [Advenella faeciporci]GGW81044.1 hypothetical protein GCM10011450_08560 [Advenella faeciporci]
MNPNRQPLQHYLAQILEAIKRLQTHTGNISEINFLSNIPAQDSSLHELANIAQSCRALCQFYELYAKANPQIPFQAMARFDQLPDGEKNPEILDLEAMDLWEIIKVDLPRFQQQVTQAQTVLKQKKS